MNCSRFGCSGRRWFGGGSSAHSAPSDTTPPSQPTDVVIKNDGKQITGKAEPGSKITIKDDQGNVIANGKADEQGNFSIDLNPPKNNGEKVEVTATDNAGNTSTPTDVIASDSTPPNKPKNLDVSDDGTHVTGTAEPGSTVTVKDENGKEIGTATAGDNGKFDVTINPPKTNGEELTVEAKDEAGNPSQPNTVKADDSTPPAKPENLGVSDDGTRVTGTAEPGSTVTVKDEKDNVIGTGKANEEDGKFDITLDEPKTALEELSVTATDNANNESNSEKVTAPLVVPKTKPDFDYAVPVAGVDKLYNAKEVGTDGTITVKVIPNANIGDSISITRDGKTEVFKITTDNKNGIEVEVKPGSEISAFIIGANGVAGEIASKTLQNADVDVPNVKPIITFESTGTDNIYNIEEVEQDKPNTITATVKFPDAQVGDIVVVNGQETRITTENLRSGVEVEVEPNTEVKAYIKDDAGNQGFISTSIAPKADLEKPDAPIKVDVASDNSPADNVLTRNEINKNGEVPVRVYLPQGLEEGDKLIVTPLTEDKKGSPIEHPLTKAEIDQGYAIVDAPTGVDALGRGKVSFTAQLIDKAGNSSTEKDSDNYDVKRTLLGKPSVEYLDDKDNNQVLLGEELVGNTTSVKINLPYIGEGDKVSITINGEEYGVDVITQKVTHNDKTFEFKPATDDDGYTVTINDISIADGSISEVVTNVVVTANNTELKANGTLCIDRSQPGGRDNNGDAKGDDKPKLEIPEAVNPSLEKDGNINAQELSDGVVAKVTLPEGVQAGDVIVIKNNGQKLYTYTIPQGTTTTKGSVIEFSIPKEKLPSGAYELSASVKEPDSYGDKARESEDSDTVAFKIDNSIPGDSNDDGVVNGSDENSGQPIVTVKDSHTDDGQDKPVGNKDLENGIQVEVTIPKGTEAGDAVEVTVKTPNGEVKKTAKVEEGDLPGTGDGKVTVTVPTEQLPKDGNGKVLDGDYSVTAKVTDPAGNSSPDSDEVTFAVDTTAPGDENGDGKVDAEDKNAGKPVIDIPEATDADGNTINADDLKDDVQVEVTLPGGVAAGDVVTLEVTTPNSNDPIKVTQTLESGDITAGKVTVDIPKADLPKDSDGKVDGAYQVTATVSDKAGNTSLVSDAKGFTIDATVPGDTNGDGKADTNDINGKPSVSIPEDTDGGVTATEFNDGVQVKVTLPEGTQKGDTITLTVTPKGGEAFTVISDPISDNDLSAKTATVTIPKNQFPETPKGDYTVSAQIKDAAGNQSLASVEKTFTVLDTVVPGDTNGDGVADSEDDNGGKPNVSVVDAHTSDNQYKPVGSDDLKDGVQVEVTLPEGTEVGDTVTVTMTKPDGSTVTATGTVAKGDLPGTGDGKVTVTVPNKQFPTDEKGKITEGEYKVTATVKDADGNTSQPSNEAIFKVDTTVPGDSNGDGVVNEQDANGGKPVVAIPEATDADGNTINADDLKDGVQVKVTLPAGTQQGDQVYLTLTPEGKASIAIEPPYEVKAGDLNGERTVEITIPKDILPKDADSKQTLDGNFTVTAQVKDAAGNTSQPSDKASFTVDTVEISGEPVVTIPEMDNNSVNASEFATAQGVDIKVTIPEGTQAGDTLTVTVSADGKAPITITKNLTAEDLNATDGLTIHIPASKENDQANSFPVKADGSYVVVAKVSDGTTTVESESTSLVIDTTVPGDSNGDGFANGQGDDNDGKPVITIPEAKDGVSASELDNGVQVNVTLPKGTQAGDTVTLTVTPKEGKSFEVAHTVNANDDLTGTDPVTITIPKDNLPKDRQNKTLDGEFTVTAKVTDAAGNSSATSDEAKFTVDATVPGDTTGDGVVDNDGKPVVTILEATEADNHIVNAKDFKDGVQVQVTLPKGTEAGDTVTLTVTPKEGQSFEVPYTVKGTDDVTGSGSVTVDIPTTKFPSNPDGDYTVTAVVTDAAGNSSAMSDAANFTIDITAPGDTNPAVPGVEEAPEVSIPEADNGVNDTEWNGGENQEGAGIQVKVTLPNGTRAGDTVTLTVTNADGTTPVFTTKPYEVQKSDLTNGATITIPTSSKLTDGDYHVTALVTDQAGNAGKASDPADFTLDTTATGKPTIEGFVSDNNPQDNIITRNEVAEDDSVQVKVTLPDDVKAGDVLYITPITTPKENGVEGQPVVGEQIAHTISDAEASSKSAIVSVPTGVEAEKEGVLFVAANILDKAGNDSKVSNLVKINVNRALEGKPNIVYTSDADQNGVLMGDEIANNVVSVKVNLPTVNAGDTVAITINGDNTYTVDLSGDTKVIKHGDKTYELKAEVADGKTEYTTTINDVEVDANATSITSSIVVTPTSGEKTEASQTIQIDRNQPGGTTDADSDSKGDGKPSITIPEASNPSLDKDGKINAAELSDADGVVINVTVPAGTEAGDIIVIKNNGSEIYTFTIPADTTIGTDPIAVTVPKDKFTDGETYNITASVKEPYSKGARESEDSDQVTFTVDTTVPGDSDGNNKPDNAGKPVVTLPDGVKDGVNVKELSDGIKVQVTLPKGTQEGDTVILTVKADDGTEQEVTYTVKHGDDVNGTTPVEIPITKDNLPKGTDNAVDGNYTVTAKVTDPAGNSSKDSDPVNFKVDTTVPGDSNGDGVADDDGKPVIESIPEATEADGYSINATEFSDGIEVQVRLPQGTQVGDTVTLTLQPQIGKAITVDYKVQASDLSGSDLIATIPVERAKFPEQQADGEYTVTAQVKDPAGNNSLESESKTFTVDTQAPTVTTPVAKKDGSVVITLPNDADKVTVTVQPEGETKPRDIILTKGDDGSWTSSDPAVVPNVPNGSTTTTIPNDKVTDGSEVTVSAQDKAGNSHSARVHAVDVNDAPVLTIKPEDIVKTGFTKGQATADKLIATVTATDPDKDDTVTIQLLNNDDGYFVLDSGTGEISLTEKGATFVNAGNNLPSIQVKAIDDKYLGSEEKTVDIADTIDTSNTLKITSNDGESVTGTTDPLSTVEIRNANNEVVGRGAADSDGKFTITLTHEEVVSLGTEKANQDIQADHNGDGEPETYHTDEEGNYRYTVDSPIKTGETLTVTSTNSYDNRATEQSPTPDEIAPSAPVIEINEQGTVISGIAEPGSTIELQVTSKDGQPVAIEKNDQPIIANEKGEFTIELEDPLIGKETITATAKDKAHNISPSSDSITAPYFNNQLKDVDISLRNDTGVSDRDNITNDGGLKLVGDDNAMITKVEYKDAEGNYQTVPYVEGVYILPEGEYTVETIRITQQDKEGAIKYSTNAEKFVIDTTAPDAATAVNDQNGNVTITLPHNAPQDDYVEVMVGNQKVTLTSDGNNGWESDNTELVPTPRDNEVTISHTVAPSGTGVSVQSFDIAGNKAKKYSDNTLIDPTKITVALEHPEVNSNLMNDTDTTMVLNTAELEASGSPSNVTVKIYLPNSAKVGDFVEFPFGSSTLQAAVKQTDIENGYFEVKAGFPINFALSQGENKYPVKLYQSDKTTVKSESEPLLIYVDKLTPDTPVVTSETGGKVSITLPTGARSNFDPSTSIGTQAEVGDWVIITAGDQSVKLTKTATNGWEKSTEADWITINGNTATIPTNIEKFPYGTTVTAQAFDKAGNQSEQGVGHVVKDPLKFTDFKVNNQDLDTTTPNIVDTNQKAIYYTATVKGQEAEEAIIRVRLMKGDQQVEVHYLDISSDSQTYKGAFNNLSADYEQYQVIADIVHQDKNTRFNDANLPERSVDVIVDNVVPQLDLSKITSSVSDGPNNKPNSVTIVATDGSHTLKDGNTKVSGAAEMTMKLDFGNAQSDKQRIITDKLGNKVVVYNPKLDWMMRKDDDDDTSSNPYHNDHAQGWGFDTKTAVMYNQDKALFYKWNGDNEAADIIVSGMSRTDEWWDYYNRRGWIGAENSGSSASLTNKTMTQFIMDTLGGGNDYISAPAIAGNVVIRTNDGDDMITTMNLQGRYDYYIGLGYSRPNVDGSNQIYMGDGNDTFEVTGTAKDTEDPNKAGAVRDEMKYASLYATNAKIDMGAGNDKVSIKWNVFTGSQKESGNYFNLGEGDDTMIVGGNVLGQLRENSYEGSTIINLGSGNDTLSLAKIERESNYERPLVLITSKESANVTIGNVKEAQLSMMMGNGEDKVTISKDLILSGKTSDWISQVFANNDRFVQQGIERYKNFYDQALKDQINSSLERAIDLIATDSQDRSATGGRAVVGADRVATSTSESITEIIDVLDLGDGQNTLSVTGKMSGVNYFGGKDVDTIQSGVTENSRFWLGLGEDSVELAQMSNSAIYAGAGEDKITVGGIAKQEGRGSIISAEDGNDTIIINALPKKSVALEADNSRISGGKGDDTITIKGDLFGMDNQIFGDAGNDTITISGNIRGYNNLIDGGAGDDTITLDGDILKDLGGKFEIRGGEGNDTISVGNIGTENNVSIFAGNGNDIVTIKNVKGDNDHIIDLGEDKTDYDILSIEGSQSEGYNNQFSIGGRPSEHTQIWGAEEIRFTGTGVTVKIESGNLVNNNTGLPPAGKDELFIRNDGGDATNKVVLSGSGWTKSETAVEHSFNGVSYRNVDVYKHSSSEDILYIQQGVKVII
ncbi:Ig-like domain-containing protein [Gallibacterium genomosp. 1]|uniref:Ig-like domain-containing protein n=1 Tax=Gallibacterium genomosp. 1 TaxID=155515 RepID=UPI001E50C788|nr:Ig-like domain-containing protein [Gallibacterium genomosp. 1]